MILYVKDQSEGNEIIDILETLSSIPQVKNNPTLYRKLLMVEVKIQPKIDISIDGSNYQLFPPLLQDEITTDLDLANKELSLINEYDNRNMYITYD